MNDTAPRNQMSTIGEKGIPIGLRGASGIGAMQMRTESIARKDKELTRHAMLFA